MLGSALIGQIVVCGWPHSGEGVVYEVSCRAGVVRLGSPNADVSNMEASKVSFHNGASFSAVWRRAVHGDIGCVLRVSACVCMLMCVRVSLPLCLCVCVSVLAAGLLLRGLGPEDIAARAIGAGRPGVPGPELVYTPYTPSEVRAWGIDAGTLHDQYYRQAGEGCCVIVCVCVCVAGVRAGVGVCVELCAVESCACSSLLPTILCRPSLHPLLLLPLYECQTLCCCSQALK